MSPRTFLTLTVALLLATPAAAPAAEPAPDHWAFRPVARPAPPAVDDTAWSRNPIDRFVHHRLAREGLEPSPRAAPLVLLRRAHIGILGLSPTAAEVARFAGDGRPDAFKRVIDELLARPRYGERWARHWLDLARYSDTKGYVDAGERFYPFAYTYRDYVIRSFNDDLPFDRFVLEQLAADRLADRDGPAALAALGFLTVGSRYNFFPHEIADDRIDVVTRGLLGLTVTCARCHDHKYDPIPAADYYALYGVFASSREPSPHELPLLSPEPRLEPELAQKLEEKARELQERRRTLHAQIQHEMRAWAGDYLVYIVETLPAHRTVAQPPLRTERGLLREVTAYGRGGVVRWRRAIDEAGPDDPVFGPWNRLVSLPREEVRDAVERELRVLEARGALNALVAHALRSPRPPEDMVTVARRYGALLEETERLWREAQARESPPSRFDDPAREELRRVLYGRVSPATMPLDDSEDLYHLDEHTDVRTRYAEVERVFLEASPRPARAMVLVDRAEPREPHVFVRGDPERRGPVVPRRLPGVLAAVSTEPFEEGSGRLDLARGIVHPANPLTARVIVNRIWAWHFGRGLVTTPSDFGRRSARPSHPELLDYLAGWLIDHGWSLKALHRLILTSMAWQQASLDRPRCRGQDPGNALLWRANRRRLDFEVMRDSMLAVSGRLDSRAGGGPPVREAPDAPDARHRTIYGLLDRELLSSVFRVFDFPSPDISCPERSTTTVPQQALFLLNSPFVLAQADALAERVLCDAPAKGNAEIVRTLFRRVYARAAAEDEVALAVQFLETRRRGSDRVSERALVAELAQVLLQSNEFLFVD